MLSPTLDYVLRTTRGSRLWLGQLPMVPAESSWHNLQVTFFIGSKGSTISLLELAFTVGLNNLANVTARYDYVVQQKMSLFS